MSEIKRGDIWYIQRGYITVGSEQRPGRPAIVVSNDRNNEYSSTLEVVYLTTQPKHDLPTHVTIRSINRESIALCEQITSVAVERFGDYCGRVTEQEMSRIETAMQISLALDMVAGPVSVREAPPPAPDSKLVELEARCAILQQMYDSLLNRLVNAG